MKPKSFAEIIEAERAATMERLLAKVPEWRVAAQDLVLPTRLSTEQCSSSAAARYKASLIESITGRSSGLHIADLTGGLGVDCWAFSQIASSVLYNEMNGELTEAVEHNFAVLGVSGVIFQSSELVPSSIPGGKSVSKILGTFCPDVIFLDPARRSESGRKVFLLEDCRPDICALKDELLAECPDVVVKLSPMADISQVCRQLGSCVKEVHIVGLNGECKELLLWLHRSEEASGPKIVVAELSSGMSISFYPAEEKNAQIRLTDGSLEGQMLFEPGAALLKSGCFNLLCVRFGLSKLGRSTHLYIVPDEVTQDTLNGMGKFFIVKEMLSFDKRTLKSLGERFHRCEITARNIPVTSDELRKRLGSKSGSPTHLFALTIDQIESDSGRFILVTEASK